MGGYDNELSKLVAELNRAAPSQKQPAAREGIPTGSLERWLQKAAAHNASDVLLITGAPPMLRINGNLAAVDAAPLEAEDVRTDVLPLLEPWQLEEL